MILADVGEIGIYHGGREIILRPSLYAMSRIADKHQIVNIFSQVMAGDHALSLLVIQACANEDISDIYGMYERTDKGFEFLEGDTSKNEANTRGDVVPAGKNNGAQSQGSITVNLIESPDRGGQVEQTSDDSGVIIDVFVADIIGGGDSSQVLESTYGLRRMGR